MERPDKDPMKRPEVRWTFGCLVAAFATVGLLILFLVVAFALEPPTWIGILLGIGLVAGGALLAWLVASALGQSLPGSGRTLDDLRRKRKG